MTRKLTPEKAAALRCRDCFGNSCQDPSCPLFHAIKRKKITGHILQIYCKWCMNNNSPSLCASPDCPIFQLRAAASGILHVDFIPA